MTDPGVGFESRAGVAEPPGSPRPAIRGRSWIARSLGRVGLRPKLILLTVAATALVLTATAYVTAQYLREHLLEVAVETSSMGSDSIRVVLEAQMVAGDRELLRTLVAEIGQQPNISWIGLLDREGEVQVSSDERILGKRFPRSSPDCQVCHAVPEAKRRRSVTLVRDQQGAVLRTVTPLVNRPLCHECHRPEDRFNGMLIIDRSLTPLQQAVVTGRHQVIMGSVAALFVLLASLGLGIERLVLQRLRRLRKAAAELGRGVLTARASDSSGDEMGELARDFNAMAERLAATIAALAAERQRLEELVNGIGDGVILADTDLRVVTTNQAFSDRLSSGKRPTPGSRYLEAASAAGFDTGSGEPPAQRVLESGRIEKEIICVRRGEDDTYEEIYAQPLRAPEGGVRAVIEVWRDITDRKALEAGLEHSERLAALGMLASSVAHEIGTPLASIATAVEGLLRRLDAPDAADIVELRDYLTIVRNQVFRCSEVTTRLLGFARLQTKGVNTVDAAAAAREVVALVAPRARAQDVELRTDLDVPILVEAEDHLLEHVFLNLVVNALHQMPKGGVLTVEARLEQDAACVVVTDTGPGIPEETRRHLFGPFRHGRSDRASTGLGLFLSHTLVRRCGGTITVASEPGKGASFTVRLKRTQQSKAPATASSAQGS